MTVEGARCPVREVHRIDATGEVLCRVEHPAQWVTVLLLVPASKGEPQGWVELYELADPATLDEAARATGMARLQDEVAFWGGEEEAEVDASRQRPADAPPRLATLKHDDYLAIDDAPVEGLLYDDERGLHWLVARTADLTMAEVGLSVPPPPPERGLLARLLGR